MPFVLINDIMFLGLSVNLDLWNYIRHVYLHDIAQVHYFAHTGVGLLCVKHFL